jgi:hypothetical protein
MQLSRLSSSLLVGTATLATVLTPTSATAADTPGCATRAEFSRIERGMSMPRVVRILDTDGSSTGIVEGPGYDTTGRLYRKCGPLPALASVSYRRADGARTWRVTSKSW